MFRSTRCHLIYLVIGHCQAVQSYVVFPQSAVFMAIVAKSDITHHRYSLQRSIDVQYVCWFSHAHVWKQKSTMRKMSSKNQCIPLVMSHSPTHSVYNFFINYYKLLMLRISYTYMNIEAFVLFTCVVYILVLSLTHFSCTGSDFFLCEEFSHAIILLTHQKKLQSKHIK